jgi:hypothetical protein
MPAKNARIRILKTMACLMALVFVLSAADSAQARRRRHRRRHHRRAKKRAVINEPDLYQRMGGSKVVSDLVNEWVASAMADGRLQGAFGADAPTKPAALNKIKKDLTTEVCELSDGPCKISDPKKLPDSFALPEEKFVVFADHLVRSMDKLKIREREKNELLGRIGEARADGTSEPADSEDDDAGAADVGRAD